MGWLELLSDGMKLLSDKLGFSPETGMAVTWEPHDLDRVLLRPDVRFGQPCIKATRVPTWVLWSHVEGNGGPRPDTYRYVADAFAVNDAAVEQAYVWEQRVQQPLATQGQILD